MQYSCRSFGSIWYYVATILRFRKKSFDNVHTRDILQHEQQTRKTTVRRIHFGY